MKEGYQIATADESYAPVQQNPELALLRHLSRRNLVSSQFVQNYTGPSDPPSNLTIRQLWEASDISAQDFADEVAVLFQLPRMTLPELMSARSLTARFAQRFLREAAVFPFAASNGGFGLAVGDPTDVATQQGVELALGSPVEVVVASFEDIATALAERLSPDAKRPSEASESQSAGDIESVDSLRDLASGAPSCALSTNSWKRRWSCAPATSISSPCATA